MNHDAKAITDEISRRLRCAVVPDDEADARRQRWATASADATTESLWQRAEVPRRHAERAIARVPIDETHPWARERSRILGILGKSGVTLCLTGTRGSGKTQIAVDAIRAVTAAGRPAVFTTAQRFFIALKASYDGSAKRSEMQVLESFRRPSLLVIDEIGNRSESDWENRTFFELLDSRYGDMTDTILTCNLEPQEVSANLGPSIVSRMSEGGGIIRCSWPSFR
ncbi:MAG: ATP-binding protein [Verrucomicrobiales bacterium]|nr:ATP-binding protein [Verrucomicrobiales bacterium]